MPVQHDLVVASVVPFGPAGPLLAFARGRARAGKAIATEHSARLRSDGTLTLARACTQSPEAGAQTILLSILALAWLESWLPFAQGCLHRLCFISGAYSIRPVHRGHDARSDSHVWSPRKRQLHGRAFPRRADSAAATRWPCVVRKLREHKTVSERYQLKRLSWLHRDSCSKQQPLRRTAREAGRKQPRRTLSKRASGVGDYGTLDRLNER